MFKPDKDQFQQSPQQAHSPYYIEAADEFIHELKKVEDFGDLSKDAVKALSGMFAQLQLCHENAAKLAGHMVQLNKMLQPEQFTYVKKHSL